LFPPSSADIPHVDKVVPQSKSTLRLNVRRRRLDDDLVLSIVDVLRDIGGLLAVPQGDRLGEIMRREPFGEIGLVDGLTSDIWSVRRRLHHLDALRTLARLLVITDESVLVRRDCSANNQSERIAYALAH
jgi:hypothetical protein